MIRLFLRVICALVFVVMVIPDAPVSGIAGATPDGVGQFLRTARHALTHDVRRAAADIRASHPGYSAVADAKGALHNVLRKPPIVRLPDLDANVHIVPPKAE